MAITIAPIADVTEYGLLFIYMTDLATGQLKTVTAAPVVPVFKVNGSIIVVTGPWWGDKSTTHYGTFVAYRPAVDILPTDVVTWSAANGWATAGGVAVPGAVNGTVNNFVGQSEPGRGNWNGVAVSPWNATPVLKLGYDIGATCIGSCYSFWQDWQRLIFSIAGVLTSDPVTNRPMTCNGNVTFQLGPIDNTGAVDGRGMPVVMGEINYIVDEKTPATPMRLSLTPSFTNVNITGPVITPGVIDGGGVERGRKFTWQVAYNLAEPTSFTVAFNFSTKTPSGTSGPYTLTNERLFMPGAGTPGASIFSIHPYVKAWMTTASGKTPDNLRWMDVVRFQDGQSNSVHPGDDRQANAWANGVRTVRTANITAVRHYDTTASPTVWFEQQYPLTTSPGGGPSPYALTASDPGYGNWTGPTSSIYAAELVLAAPATPGPLLSGQYSLTLSGVSLNGIPCSNGDQAPTTVNLNGAVPYSMWMTSATTAAIFPSRSGGFANSNGQAGGLNNIIGNNPVSSATISVVIPTAFSSIEACIQATADMPGTAFWWPTPPGTAIDHITADVNKIIAGIPAGTEVWHSISNEVWSNISPTSYFNGIGRLKAFMPAGEAWPQSFVHACKWVWDIGDALFAAAGRSADYKHILDSQFGAPSTTQLLINTVNTWNAANPSNPIRVDKVAVAPYANCPADPALVRAWAQTYSTDSRSIAFGDANPFTMAQVLDLFAHYNRYNTLFSGWYGGTLAAVKTYHPVAGQSSGFVPEIDSYEAAIQSIVPDGVSTDVTMRKQMIHDLCFHPVMAKVHKGFYLAAQDGGFRSMSYQTLAGQRCLFGTLVWGQYSWAGQQPGDGLNNHFWIDDHFGHDGPANGFPANVCVMGYAWQQWADVANTPVPPPPPPANLPAISLLMPSSGPEAGATSVVIAGTYLTGATAVMFGTQQAASYAVNSDIQITAVSPAGTGTVDVRVTTPVGVSTISTADQFTYIPPPASVIAYVDPKNLRLAQLALALFIVIDTAGGITANKVLSIGQPPAES